MSFENNNYILLKNFLHKDVTNLLYEHIKLKKQVADFYIKLDSSDYDEHKDGYYNDDLVPNTFSCYSDIIFESLMLQIKPRLEEITKLKLTPTYSYWRLYKTNDDLKNHRDKIACEISTTVCLGYEGDEKWPIYFSKNRDKSNAVELITEPGDLVIYKGCKMWHWREQFKGIQHAQAFLHFNNVNNDFAQYSKYDCKPLLGLSSEYRDDYKLSKCIEISNQVFKDG